jgi:ATP-dependent Lon protease
VNEKIEGFFDTCEDIGLTGAQGVIIPRANAGDLMLRHDVVEACRNEKFRVHAVSTVLEALELLTDIPVGKPDEEGNYAEGTLMATAHERAFEYWLKAAPNAEAFFDSQEEGEQQAGQA